VAATLLSLPLWFLIGSASILGAIWGSFVAALCSRWPRNESVARGRSHCETCNHTLSPVDLVPIVSFILLRGRCRYCLARIGGDALAIEAFAAVMGGASFILLPAPQALAAAIFGWLLLPLIVLDLRHLWLPDRLIILLAFTGALIGPLLSPDIAFTDRLIGAIAGYVALEAIRRFYRMFRKREGMGAGDPKLFATLGIWLGWQSLPMILLLASLLGLISALAIRIFAAKLPGALPLGSYFGFAAILIANFI